jgi:hypothetical protein
MAMTSTAETIHTLNKFRKDVNTKMTSREIVSFNISDIEIENEKMLVDGDVLTESATKKVLNKLRVKNNFFEISKSLSHTDWNLVKDKLKQASGSQTVHGRKIMNGTLGTIDDIYMAAPRTTGILEIDSIFHEVIDSIIGTGKDISIKSTYFLEDKDEVVVTLLENDNTIDIFGTDEDLWKVGKRIVWNGLNFSVSPFFERLVCTNGNTAPQYGFKANVSNNKFNMNRIKKILEKEIVLESDTMTEYLVDATNHLKSTNVSVREFMKFKNLFNEDEHSAIIKKWLDDSAINRAYGCVASEMPELWKTTADSGKNAYDFFNDLTYIAAHPDEATITDRERIDLQIKASDLLFKKDLDLELVAPKVKWSLQ